MASRPSSWLAAEGRLRQLPPEQITRLRDHGVSTVWLNALQQAG